HKKHSTIEVDKIKESIQKSFESIYSEIEGLSKSHPTYEPIDKIKDELTKLFDGKIGKPYPKEKLNDLFKEGQARYDNEIPPGYKDRSSKKDSPKQSLYGDIILWKQIIDKAKADNMPIILVTDDLKDDWWDKFKGETQGPRKELLREFLDETGQRIYIYQADKFLEYANKLKIGKTIREEAIKEIRDVRIKDEQRLKELSYFSESIKKRIETRQNYFESEEFKKMLDRLSEQKETRRLDPETLKRIQDNLDNHWTRALKFNYSDVIDNLAVSYPFTDQQRVGIQRMIETYANKKSDNKPTREGTIEDKPNE
ncbi:MAG: hypothetical protein KDC99_18040, partial [Cyclobacteriaceae bacterium]|nr:hypothetical protein [Cyclobacteriaceae bacterium]